jgi:hypothetical protein
MTIASGFVVFYKKASWGLALYPAGLKRNGLWFADGPQHNFLS